MFGIILGNPNSVFVYRQAKYFIERGIRIRIITYHAMPDKVNIIDSKIDYESIITIINTQGFWTRKIKRIGRFIETRYARIFNKKPFLIFDHLFISILIRGYIKKMKPDFIFGHNLISYGIATCLAPQKARKFMLPYGGDIFYIDDHPIRYSIFKFYMNRVNKFFPTAEYGKKIFLEKFNIESDKVDVISWGVDLSRFQNNSKILDKAFVLDYLNVDSNTNYDIILNIRRFRPEWGCIEALDVAKKLLAKRENVLFVFIGGSGSDSKIWQDSMNTLTLSERNRIKFLGERIPEGILDKIISSSTLFLSLLKVEDMRSSSILEGIAAKSVPVVTRCKEYRFMEDDGFVPVYVSLEKGDIIEKISIILDDEVKRNDIIEMNWEYVKERENMESQMDKLAAKLSTT